MTTKQNAITIAKEVKQIAKSIYGDELLDLIMYGSYARNEAWEESDLDLFLLFKTPQLASQIIHKMHYQTSTIQNEKLIYLSFMISDEMKFSNTPLPIYHNIKNEGIRIV
jgi:predicted nucleotidyltransferase